MAIRYAAAVDIPALVALGARMHALSRFNAMAYDARRVATALETVMKEKPPRHLFLVAESSRGEIVGALMAVLERHIFSDAVVSSIMHFMVLPEWRMGAYGLRLLQAFERWSKNRNAAELHFGITNAAEMDRVARFAQRVGYRKVGENYIKTVVAAEILESGKRHCTS